jgi:diadenosine tetraphosphatase ApaH/serine/threonine PP2A family protein phosphatase
VPSGTRGNTDDLIAAPEEGNVIAQRDREVVGDDLAAWLAGLPVEHEEGVVLTHATRRSNADRLPSLDADDAAWLNAYGPAPAIVVCGHSHVAFTRQVGPDLRVLNTGSVGAPFDGDPRAAYLVGTIERGVWTFSQRRVEYDREPAAGAFDGLGHREARRFARAIRTGYP